MIVLIKCTCPCDAFNQEKTVYYTNFGFSDTPVAYFDVQNEKELNRLLEEVKADFEEYETDRLEQRVKEEGFKIDEDRDGFELIVTYEILKEGEE